jgi:small subunit ribosomal protein S6
VEGRLLLRTYELMFIAQPDLDEENLNALIERVKQTTVDNGGEIVKVEPMGRRRLAYEVAKRREGHYVLIHANLDRQAMAALERDLRLSEDVLRHLLIRLDEEVSPA